MTRFFKYGDMVDVARPELQKLLEGFIPGFPEKVTSTTGTIVDTYRLRKHDNTGWVTVQLSMCPEIRNLQFETHHLELIMTTEVRSYVNELHSRIDMLDHRLNSLQDRFDSKEEQD